MTNYISLCETYWSCSPAWLENDLKCILEHLTICTHFGNCKKCLNVSLFLLLKTVKKEKKKKRNIIYFLNFQIISSFKLDFEFIVFVPQSAYSHFCIVNKHDPCRHVHFKYNNNVCVYFGIYFKLECFMKWWNK